MAKPEEKSTQDLKALEARVAALEATVKAQAAEIRECADRQRRHHAACPCNSTW